MQFGRSFWAVPVLAVLSLPTAVLTGLPERSVSPTVSLSSANTVAVYVSGPGVEGPPALAGLTMETFNSRLACPSGSSATVTSGSALAVGRLSTNNLTLGCLGAATTSATPMPHTDPAGADYPGSDRSAAAWPANGNATITLYQPSNYFGVYWFWGNSGDAFELWSQGQRIIRLSTVDLTTHIPIGGSGTVNAIGGGTYQQNHYLGGRKGFGNGSNTEPMVYNGLVGVTLSGSSTAPVLTPTTKQVTFDSNGGGGSNSTQSASTGTSDLLNANTFTAPQASSRFLGWNTAANGSGTSYGDGANFPFTSDTTLYAEWTEVPSSNPAAPQLPLVTLPVATKASPPAPTRSRSTAPASRATTAAPASAWSSPPTPSPRHRSPPPAEAARGRRWSSQHSPCSCSEHSPADAHDRAASYDLTGTVGPGAVSASSVQRRSPRGSRRSMDPCCPTPRHGPPVASNYVPLASVHVTMDPATDHVVFVH